MTVRSSLAWMAFSQLTYFVTQFVGSVIIAHLLSPYDMGVFALASSIAALLSIIQATGAGAMLIRAKDLDPVFVDTAFTVNALSAVLLSLLTVVVGLFGGAAFHEKGVLYALMALAIVPLISSLEFRPGTILVRDGQFKLVALSNSLRTLSAMTVTILFAVYGYRYLSFAYGQICGAVISAGFLSFVGRRHVSFRPSLVHWRAVLSFGAQMFTINGLNSIASRLSDFVLGRILGLSALGLYSRATSINNLLWDNIHLTVGKVVMTDLAARRRAGGSLRTTYLTVVDFLTAVLWPAFAGLAITARPLIYTIYGAKWTAAAAPLSVLSLSSMVLVSITMSWELFIVCGETGTQARFEPVRTGAGLALFTLGSCFNITAAAFGRMGEALVSFFVYRPHINRMAEIGPGDLRPIYVRGLVLTAVTVAPAAVLMQSQAWSERTPFWLVGASALLGGAFYVATLIFMRHPLFEEAAALIGKGRPEPAV